MAPAMGPAKALIAVVSVVVVTMALPAASAFADSAFSSKPMREGDSSRPTLVRYGSTAGPDAPDASAGSPGVGLSIDIGLACGPSLVLERDWYGGQVQLVEPRDMQVLLPVAVVGQLGAIAPAVGQLLGSVVRTVQSAVDVAVVASWTEDYVTWDTYTDRLYVGLGAVDAASLHGFGVQGWDPAGVELRCDGAQGIVLVPDARASEVTHACLACLALPADGWVFADLLDLDVHLAKARDYDELPLGRGVSACPTEVADAIQRRIDELAPTIDDVLAQQPERQLAGLPTRL